MTLPTPAIRFLWPTIGPACGKFSSPPLSSRCILISTLDALSFGCWLWTGGEKSMKHVLLSFLTTMLIVAMTLSAMVILVRATLYVTSIESPLQRAGAIGAELLLGVVLLLGDGVAGHSSGSAYICAEAGYWELMEEELAEKNHVTWKSSQSEERLDQLRRISDEAEAGGGAERREKEHKAGKLSARERIHLLLDEGTFEELGQICAAPLRGFWVGGESAGWGRICHWIRADRGPVGLCVCAGFYRVWRIAFGVQRGEDLQDYGSGNA